MVGWVVVVAVVALGRGMACACAWAWGEDATEDEVVVAEKVGMGGVGNGTRVVGVVVGGGVVGWWRVGWRVVEEEEVVGEWVGWWARRGGVECGGTRGTTISDLRQETLGYANWR